jgi:hypothetical protein
MSDERTYYENIRRRADLAQERLAAMLEQARRATARDERVTERRAERDSSQTRKPGKGGSAVRG